MNQNVAPIVFLLGYVPYASAEDETGGDPWKNYWIAHGVCASFAWAIIVPLAIGTALLRKKFVGETWFQIHRLLNSLAAILTVVAFSIAVYVIRQEDGKSPWKEYPHFIVGLAIFIATLLQAGLAIIRPPHPVEHKLMKEELGFSNENAWVAEDAKPAAAQKSILRRMWEIKHRLFGICLLATAWWQVQDGWTLYEEEVSGKDVGMGFMGAAGGISGTIAIFYVLQLADPRP